MIAFVELEGLEKATPDMIQRAILSLLIFRDNGKGGVWSKISRIDYANSLIKLVRNPDIINQASTNLCGIAATVHAMVEYDPESFVDLAIGLFENGKAKSKSFFHSDISANEELLNKKPTNGLDNVGYVIMTSMRDSYNLMPGYDPSTDTGLKGFTYPGDISDIATNFANMKDVTWDYSNNVAGLNKALSEGATIIALFDADMLKTGKPNPDFLQKTFGNHYVIINSITQKGKNITINYWNWGDTSKKQTTITTTKDNYDKAIKNYTILNSK